MDLRFHRQTLAQHGAVKLLYYGLSRGAARLAKASLWNVLVISPEQLDPQLLAAPAAARVEETTPEALRPFVSRGNTLTHDFLDEAASRGDRCFAVFDAGRLASYGWYATTATPLLTVGPELKLRFDARYVYMHNGYTHPAARGQGLYPVAMAVALKRLADEGRRGLISVVATSNFASLNAFHRMGCTCVGRFATLRRKQRLRWVLTPGCRRCGLQLVRA